jgi:hypothetical protein
VVGLFGDARQVLVCPAMHPDGEAGCDGQQR